MNKNDQQKIIQEGHENFIKKNYGAARTSWLKLLEIEPKNISLLKSISLTYYYENNLEDTENFLKKIVEINLSDAEKAHLEESAEGVSKTNGLLEL